MLVRKIKLTRNQRYMKKLLLHLLIIGAFSVVSQAQSLEGFDPLIGGKWWMGTDSYQTFEWGVGQQSIKAATFSVSGNQVTKVSQGEWFWHPALQSIKGFFTAIDMPITFFDYTTTFDDGTMINHIEGYTQSGEKRDYIETWVFTGSDSFEWVLSERNEDGSLNEIMSGTYSRK